MRKSQFTTKYTLNKCEISPYTIITVNTHSNTKIRSINAKYHSLQINKNTRYSINSKHSNRQNTHSINAKYHSLQNCNMHTKRTQTTIRISQNTNQIQQTQKYHRITIFPVLLPGSPRSPCGQGNPPSKTSADAACVRRVQPRFANACK